MSAIALGAAWGLLAATPFACRARRRAVAARAARLAGPPAAHRPGVRRLSRLGPIGAVLTGRWQARGRRRSEQALARELPLVLDLLGVAVRAGCPPRRALEVTVAWGPPDAAQVLDQALAATRLGDRLTDALERLAAAYPTLAPVAAVLVAGDQLGVPAAPGLARLAAEARADLRRRAEARARALPVKLLFPLVFLVLPAFGLLTVVPALLSALSHL